MVNPDRNPHDPSTAGRRPPNEHGYALAALLCVVAASSVALSVALPAWNHDARREREAELVFRGEQYARAIRLYARRTNGALPPSVDALVQGRFLRRKYSDPMMPDGRFGLVHGAGGIQGVTSRSPESSLLIYRGAGRYNEWRFDAPPRR